MNDQFMHQLRRDPPPEFARDLRERLGRDERLSPRAWRAGFLPAAMAAGFVAAAILALFAFPAVRASAQAFLDMFRVRNFTAVEIDPARLEKFRSLGENNALMVFDKQEQIQAPGPPQAFTTVAAAASAAGMELRAPAYLPQSLALDTVWVQGAGEVRLSLHESELRRVLDALDLQDVQIPAGLDGQAVTVRKPQVVVQRFKKENRDAAFVQARSPEVSLPPGVELERLGEIGLRVLGLAPDEAARLARSIDWRTTLVVPVPMNASSFRKVTVHGNSGLLVSFKRERASDHMRLRDGSVVLWTEDERVFALTTNVGSEEAMQMAESVR